LFDFEKYLGGGFRFWWTFSDSGSGLWWLQRRHHSVVVVTDLVGLS